MNIMIQENETAEYQQQVAALKDNLRAVADRSPAILHGDDGGLDDLRTRLAEAISLKEKADARAKLAVEKIKVVPAILSCFFHSFFTLTL